MARRLCQASSLQRQGAVVTRCVPHAGQVLSFFHSQVFLLDSDFKVLGESFYDVPRLGRLVHSGVAATRDVQQLATDFSLHEDEEIDFERYLATVGELVMKDETVRVSSPCPLSDKH
jgi:hypothetical protein